MLIPVFHSLRAPSTSGSSAAREGSSRRHNGGVTAPSYSIPVLVGDQAPRGISPDLACNER
ncbi:hypothetical protein GQ55_9G033000 [Panicum hallii var. hallii]|uniref:Uncharacterized protein n=1 Tax=Panicum hallii var. hallii TaxID=1504633 RepID=A0A2T7BZ77_9POAL|nr:hypothetical protein GQ55_9G033000 [Panicum hallii var. hallii]